MRAVKLTDIEADRLLDELYGVGMDVLNGCSQTLDADDFATWTFDDDDREDMVREFVAETVKALIEIGLIKQAKEGK